MCNCGNKRTSYTKQQQEKVSGKDAVKTVTDAANTNFEYTGTTALTVIGNVTKRIYRFNRPGETQTIDVRDVPGIKMVPVLKRR